MNFLITQLVPVISVISSAVLAYHGIEGWGWFLLVAAMFGGADAVQKHTSNK
ncbi:TPA: hypothetical protein ACJ2XZ_004339 [Yersinia enterocolitica]|jgi:hypothetical protein|nr:hypothetical protein [Yersinia enterocolitica]HEN3312126.1 hypothetical protein [Yersinia enterocolitica]